MTLQAGWRAHYNRRNFKQVRELTGEAAPLKVCSCDYESSGREDPITDSLQQTSDCFLSAPHTPCSASFQVTWFVGFSVFS